MVQTIMATLHDREIVGHDDDRTIPARVEIDRTGIGVTFLGATVNDIEADVFIEYNCGVVRVYVWDHDSVKQDPVATISLIERR